MIARGERGKCRHSFLSNDHRLFSFLFLSLKKASQATTLHARLRNRSAAVRSSSLIPVSISIHAPGNLCYQSGHHHYPPLSLSLFLSFFLKKKLERETYTAFRTPSCVTLGPPRYLFVRTTSVLNMSKTLLLPKRSRPSRHLAASLSRNKEKRETSSGSFPFCCCCCCCCCCFFSRPCSLSSSYNS